MQGFCGSVRPVAGSASAAEVVAQMASHELAASVVRDGQWAVKSDSNSADELSVHFGDGGFALIEGRPTSDNSEFSALIGEHGLARACQIRYRQLGGEFVAELRGTFSMAIWLNDESKMLLAIDRVGVQTLFYSHTDSGLAFSSRLGYFGGCAKLGLSIDPQSIYDYLYYHVIPSPNTIYKNVRALPPGSYLEVAGGHSKVTRYWQVEYSQEYASMSLDRLKDEFREALEESVRMEAARTTDIGCFLSGGTDSSTLAGVLGDVTKRPVSTYSIGFDQAGFDEMEYARMAAQHFGTDHHEYYVTPEDILELVPKISQVYGQPFGNSSVIPTFYCAQMAKADGKKVILGGDGGDELFGGNERYATQVLFSYYGRTPEILRRSLIEPIANGFPLGEKIMPVRKLRRYIEQASVPMPDRLQTYGYLDFIGEDALFDPEYLESIDSMRPLHDLRDAYEDVRAKHIVNKMLALDLKLTLGDNDLPKVSRMCELAGVTAGYPFLREPLIDFAARLPAGMKVKGLKIRWFFKEALRDYLPTGIINKQKHGFGLPFGDWVVSHNALQRMAFDRLEGLKQRHIVRADFIDNLRDHMLTEHPKYFGGLVWVLMILEQWLDDHSASA